MGPAGRVLLRPALLADRRAHPAQGPLRRRHDSDLRGRNARPGHARETAAAQGRASSGSSPTAPSWPRTSRASRSAGCASAGCSRSSTPTACGASCGACSPRKNSSARTGCARSPSFTKRNPYVLNVGGASFRVDYEPAESTSGLFGGNSNWRGPIWFPLNYLLDRIAAEVPLLPGRRLQGRVSDRLGRAC